MTNSTHINNTELDRLWVLLDQGRPDEVLGALADGEDSLPEPGLVLLALAKLDAGIPHESVRCLEKVLARNPENLVARMFLMLALHQGGEVAAAGRLLQDLLPILPHRGFLKRFLEIFWPKRAVILAHGSNPDEVEDPDNSEFEQLLAGVTPDAKPNARTRRLSARYASRGVSSFHRQDSASAFSCLYKAHRLNPGDESIAANAAFAALHCGRAEVVASMLEPFLEKAASASDPAKAPLPLPDTIVCQAWACHEQGRNEEALRLLALVEPDGPEDCYTHFIAAMASLDLGRTDDFRALLDHGLTYYFIDTWEQVLAPFVRRTANWLADETGPSST
ncbi:MAG: hypothetical protein JJU11_00115 [Candidatus Sumerlaeia bacterium]|nr:hypothetical protein [Candidatus Sumerlaeia bacterium]